MGQQFRGELKEEIDRLTRGGLLIEAVVATHPFHTLGFEPFFEVYGKNRAAGAMSDLTGRSMSCEVLGVPKRGMQPLFWFGTPRHLRRLLSIPWTGDVSDPLILAQWSRRGVEMRLPDGCEFNDPQPPESNHFSNVFVFHHESKAVHNDDCLCYFDQPVRKMGQVSISNF